MSYADVPYPGFPFARTHPDHLAGLARRFGLAPADPDACAVLEIACGDGMNLIGMAAAADGVRATGIDVDATAIARGRAVADELGLGVDLRVGDVCDRLELPVADYVICHGLYTWVPPRVADAALAALAGALAPDGVGFLSFNLAPGWGVRRALGPALARHGGDARELLATLPFDGDDPYGEVMAAEQERLRRSPDPLLVHDDLGPHTTAAWHADVVAHADHHGLHVLCDAVAPEPVADRALADLVTGQPYREVLLVPATADYSAQPSDAGWRAPERFTRAPGERPLAAPLARWQAQRGADVTTLRHTRLTIRDDAGRAILAHCDGTRDRAALARDAATALGDPSLEPRLSELMDTALERLAENALFVSAATG